MTGKRLITSLVQLIPLILVVAVIFGAIGGYVNYFVLESEYTATTSFYVMAPMADSEDEGDSIAYITYYEKLALDYTEIAKSKSIVNDVAENLGLDGLKGYEINVSPASQTRVMKLTVKGNDKNLTEKIADETVKVFAETVKRVTGAKNVNVIDSAHAVRTGPMRTRNTILMAFAGAILSIGIIVIKEFADTTFRTAEEIEELLELPVLAQVNRIKSTQPKDDKKAGLKRFAAKKSKDDTENVN